MDSGRGNGRVIADRLILKPRLWRASEAEVAALKADWMDLMGAIGAGNAAQLSGATESTSKYVQKLRIVRFALLLE